MFLGVTKLRGASPLYINYFFEVSQARPLYIYFFEVVRIFLGVTDVRGPDHSTFIFSRS